LRRITKAYTADVKPQRIAEFLVLHPSFRIPCDSRRKRGTAIKDIDERRQPPGGSGSRRIAGRLRATLDFAQIDEIMGGGLEGYLGEIRRQCGQVHGALYQTYISYPIEAALEA
jgi:uncharacterized alpha-E superfamily protein